MAARTSYRLNTDMPFAWFIATDRRILLCSTHRSRGTHFAHTYPEINELRFDGSKVSVLMNDPSGDIQFQLSDVADGELELIRRFVSLRLQASRQP